MDHSRVALLYRRLLQLPLRSLDALWMRFQQLAVERSCAEILDEREEGRSTPTRAPAPEH